MKESIHIWREGQLVIARRNSGARAEAKCAPGDEFDFGVGAKLALERLFKPEKPIRLYCVKSWPVFLTKGKVYEFTKNGIKYDNGQLSNCKDFGEWQRHNKGFAACLVRIADRPAAVGDWIGVVAAKRSKGAYENGDILEVVYVEAGFNGAYSPLLKGESNCVRSGKTYLASEEYVVLDGYVPEKKKKRIFSTVKYIESEGAAGYMRHKSWVDECEGKEIKDGWCGTYLVKDDWTVEVN